MSEIINVFNKHAEGPDAKDIWHRNDILNLF